MYPDTFSELSRLRQLLLKQILCDKLGWKRLDSVGIGCYVSVVARGFLRLRVAAILLNAVFLCGEFRPLLFFLFQARNTTRRGHRAHQEFSD